MTDTLGHFQLLEHLDDGGSADVYRASTGAENPDIALKVLKEGHRAQPGEVTRFLDEADLLRKLAHPGLPRILETGTVEGAPFIAMELVHGQSLAEYLQQQGPLSEQEALSIAGDLADTLVHVHREGLVHRDLKPANILLQETSGRTVIMDFGVARMSGASDAGYMATPRYMSPEQAGGERLDARSDLFSLGIILYEMLTGAPPFEATSLEELVEQVRSAEAPPLPARAAHAGPVVRRLLDKDPNGRFANAAEARDAIMDANEEYSSARPSSIWWFAAAVVLVAVIAGWWLA